VNFTERAREEAVNQHGNTTHASAFADGAEWGYRQAVEELRSTDAPTEMHRPYPYNHGWADWLLEKAGME